jgi:hypothetical protein
MLNMPPLLSQAVICLRVVKKEAGLNSRRLAHITSPRVRFLFAAIIAGSFMPMSADAAKLSAPDKVALKQATVACKAEMKHKKIKWPKSRRYINECLREALKDHPNIKIHKIDPRFEVRG